MNTTLLVIALLRHRRVVLSFAWLIAGSQLPLPAQNTSQPATHGGSELQTADLQKEMNSLDAEILEKQKQLSACASERLKQTSAVDNDISDFQTRIANIDRSLITAKPTVLPGGRSDYSYINGLKEEKIRYQGEIFKLQQKKNSISLDHTCENELNAQISKARSAKWAIQSKINSKTVAPITSGNKVSPPSPDSTSAANSSTANRSAPWGFGGNNRESPGLPPQPRPATFVDQDGNVVSGPPLNSDLFNNIGDLKSYANPRTRNVGSGEAPWGFGGPDADPSVVRYDSAGQPIDADGLVVEYTSEEERRYAIAEMRERAQAMENENRRNWDQQGRKYDEDRAAAMAGSWFDPFDPHPDSAIADQINWKNAVRWYGTDPDSAFYAEQRAHDQKVQELLNAPSFQFKGGDARLNAEMMVSQREAGETLLNFQKQAAAANVKENAEIIDLIHQIGDTLKANGYKPSPAVLNGQ